MTTIPHQSHKAHEAYESYEAYEPHEPHEPYWPHGPLLASLLLAGVAFFLLNRFTWLYCDDYSYAFCITDHGLDFTRPITGLRDVIVSQYYHFLHSHGRILDIGLDQWFIGMRDKLPFDICNTLVFVGYVWLLQRVARRTKWAYTVLTFVLLVAFLRAFGQVFLWMTGCLNYLWAGFVNLAFLQALRRNATNNSLRHGVLPVIVALVAGWWQESFSVGVIGAMVLFLIYRLWRRQPCAKVPVGMAVAYVLGFIIIIASPGTMARATDEGVFEGAFLYNFVRNFIHVFLGVRIAWLLVITAVVQHFRHRLVWRDFMHDNSFLLLAIAIELLFLLILGPAAEARAFFGVETFSLVLLLRLLPVEPHRATGWLLAVIALAVYLPVLRMTYHNHQVTQAFLRELAPTDGTVFFDLPKYNHTKRHYLGSLLVTDHRSKIFGQEAAYYGKSRLMVLPSRLKQELYLTSSFITPAHRTADGEYTTPDLDFTILPLPADQPLPEPAEGCEYVSFPSGNYRIKNKPYVHDGLWATKR